MTYGMPYTGSKNGIAEDIIKILPPGKRFVDLFGGGGAMTHCAVLSGKYECVLYNEILPLVADTFQKAINGYYAPENFKPYWVSREDFFRLRETDGYAALCFSFGNNMQDYFCNKEYEIGNEAVFDMLTRGQKPDDALAKNAHRQTERWRGMQDWPGCRSLRGTVPLMCGAKITADTNTRTEMWSIATRRMKQTER